MLLGLLTEKVEEPDAVTTTTNEFKNENDQYAEFIDEMLEYGPAYQVLVGDLYREFNAWRRNKYPGATDMKARTLTPGFWGVRLGG